MIANSLYTVFGNRLQLITDSQDLEPILDHFLPAERYPDSREEIQAALVVVENGDYAGCWFSSDSIPTSDSEWHSPTYWRIWNEDGAEIQADYGRLD